MCKGIDFSSFYDVSIYRFRLCGIFCFDFLLNNIKSVHRSPCSHVYIIITQQLPTFLYLLFLNFGIC